MVGKEFLKTALNIFINSVLLILYVSFFGLQSIQKYLDYGVTIVNQEEKPATIQPPGMCQFKFLSRISILNVVFTAIAIFPVNPVTRLGFKMGNETECIHKIGEQFIQCLEERSFSTDDIFPVERRRQWNASHFYADDIRGLVQSVNIDTGVISKSVAGTLSMEINSNLSYFIRITDPKLQFTTTNIDTVPRTEIPLENKAVVVNFLLKVASFSFHPHFS